MPYLSSSEHPNYGKCASSAKNHISPGEHISLHFTMMMILNVLKQILVISLNRLGKAYLSSFGIKEKNLFL